MSHRRSLLFNSKKTGYIDGAKALLSTFKLNVNYLGSGIKIRRSSDNSLLDIGFVNRYLDEDAISSFLGTDDGFVHTIYDQSGNGWNFTQTTDAKQPKIATAGVVNKDVNDVIYIQFDGVNDEMFSSAGLIPVTEKEISFFFVSLNEALTAVTDKYNSIWGISLSGTSDSGNEFAGVTIDGSTYSYSESATVEAKILSLQIDKISNIINLRKNGVLLGSSSCPNANHRGTNGAIYLNNFNDSTYKSNQFCAFIYFDNYKDSTGSFSIEETLNSIFKIY